MRRRLSALLFPICVMAIPAWSVAVHAQAIRDVTPSWLTRPHQPGPAMGVEQAPEPAVAPSLPPQSIRVRSSGEIEIDGKRTRLATIALPERTRLCPGDAGSWACGTAAYIAWVNLFRAGNVRCEVKDEGATCLQRNRPVDEILVLAGWALPEPASNDTLRSLEEEARNRKAGIHGRRR